MAQQTADGEADAIDEFPDRIDSDEPCPNCGERFGRRDGLRKNETLPEKIDGDAVIRRLSDGTLAFSVEFPCPTCGQEFLVEDLTGGTLYPESDNRP